MRIFKKFSRVWFAVGALFLAAIMALGPILILQTSAVAQSPEPTEYMKNVAPGDSYPSGAGAVVVEGLGLIGDCDTEGTLSDIENDTVAFTEADDYVVTEISPQYYAAGNCGTYTQYETAISDLITYVEANAHDPGTYWGGVMLDEEGGYGVTEAHLVDLNDYVDGLMVGTSGVTWYFTEDQPNAWTLAEYNDIVGNSYAAPQAYTSDMVDFINGECTTYSMCENLVTIDRSGTGDWSTPSYVLPLVNEYPWSNAYWGTSNWWNAWWTS